THAEVRRDPVLVSYIKRVVGVTEIGARCNAVADRRGAQQQIGDAASRKRGSGLRVGSAGVIRGRIDNQIWRSVERDRKEPVIEAKLEGVLAFQPGGARSVLPDSRAISFQDSRRGPDRPDTGSCYRRELFRRGSRDHTLRKTERCRIETQVR